MRARLLVPTVTASIALALGGCASTDQKAVSRPDPTTTPEAQLQVGPVLVLASRAGTVSVRTQTGAVAFRAPDGVAAPDSSTVVQAQPIDAGTRVVASDPITGVPRWSHDVAGTRRVRVVAPGGRFVALVDGNLNVASDQRTRTSVTVVTAEGARDLRLTGNLDPEAFSLDGRYLYVLDFLPAMNPTHYSVRRVDLQTKRIEPVPDRDGGVREPMPGYARTQLMSADGKQLYTFYASGEPVRDSGEDAYYAWVHVLNLDKGWAHCVDLDEKIGVRNDANPALAESPDGSRLFLTDGTTGAVASVDTKSLRVLRTRFEPALENRGSPALLATDGTALFLRDHYSNLAIVDPRTLVRRERVFLGPSTMTGLRIDRSGMQFYVLTAGNLLVVDPRGRVVHEWPSPGDATSLDPSVTVPGSGAYRCAC